MARLLVGLLVLVTIVFCAVGWSWWLTGRNLHPRLFLGALNVSAGEGNWYAPNTSVGEDHHQREKVDEAAAVSPSSQSWLDSAEEDHYQREMNGEAAALPPLNHSWLDSEGNRKHQAGNTSLANLTADWLTQQAVWLPEALRAGRWPKDLFSPFLVWSEIHGAFVSNQTQAELFATRWEGVKHLPHLDDSDRSRADANTEIRAFLDGMIQTGLPPVINRGSLLGFLRSGKLSTDDADFVTFRRFLHPAKHNSSFFRRCLTPPSLKYMHSVGDVNDAGYEISYSKEDVKIDLYVAEEGANSYWYPLWIRGREELHRCLAPGPTAFAPAVHIPTGARFFVPTTALLEMQHSYGPLWEMPYEAAYGKKWKWDESVWDFDSCQNKSFHKQREQQSFSSWDPLLEKLKHDTMQMRAYRVFPRPFRSDARRSDISFFPRPFDYCEAEAQQAQMDMIVFVLKAVGASIIVLSCMCGLGFLAAVTGCAD
eukprot:gnl/TRDRNA2_/TRDRNA2_154356_c0_seq1.p1 gnl/TRDRNA2_/TRDRNA2_154356_c0~~gnl/TRDRNA2_/TRDRNA2_154356_c0_seq1.p1  ORF type:complete len:481 (+),score=52.17 gnl/TRDRNA2_/TRDRNA2_154356_c0_seq1:53-1495(+)